VEKVIDTESPSFPVLAITRTRGIHAKHSAADLTPRSLAGAMQGYYDGIIVLDSNYNKWEMEIGKIKDPEAYEPGLLNRLLRKNRWIFNLSWTFDRKFDTEEMRALIYSHFDSKNDLYSEMGIDLTTIKTIASIEQAIEVFDFSIPK
jgi:hypothetical protein